MKYKFRGTEAERAGKAVVTLRQRRNLEREELAIEAPVGADYLQRLEDGQLPEVEPEVLERIGFILLPRHRGKGLSAEEWVSFFLAVSKEQPPNEQLLL